MKNALSCFVIVALLSVFFAGTAGANPLPDPVMITEFSTDPDWIEIYGYPGSLLGQTISINGVDLPITITLESVLDISTGDRIHIFLDETYVPGLDLPGEGGRIFVATAFDTLRYGTMGVIPAPPYGESSAATMYDYYYDFTPWSIDPTPTPGAQNDVVNPRYGSGSVFFNEVCPGAGEDAAANRFIELYNSGDASVDIGGWSIVADGRHVFPPGTIIGAESFHVVDVSLLPITFGLSSENETVYLIDGENGLIDQMGWTSSPGAGYSFNRIPDGFAAYFTAYDSGTLLDFRIGTATPGLPNEESYPVVAIEIERTILNLIPGQTVRFYCLGTDSNGTRFRILPEWRLDGSIGTIDRIGTATGIRCGEAVLTAEYGDLADTVTITGGVSGVMSKDAVWTEENSPYYVNERFVIDTGAVLTIEPGVEVIFTGYYSFYAYGSVRAIGTESNPIIFTSAGPENTSEDWYAIRLEGSKSVFSHCIVEYSRNGIYIHGDRANYLTIPTHEISRCILRNNEWSLYLSDGKGCIENNLIVGDGSDHRGAIFLSRSDSTAIVNNTICNVFSGINIRYSSPKIINNIISSLAYGISNHDMTEPFIAYNDVVAGEQAFKGGRPGTGEMTTVNRLGLKSDIYFNISEDPQFVNPAVGDYRLAPGSPCIDAGDPDLTDTDGSISDIGVSGGGVSTGVHQPDVSLAPEPVTLFQNYPNPFNTDTLIGFSLDSPASVMLDVYTVTGQKITTLADERAEAGYHLYLWDGRNGSGAEVSSGLYFYRLTTGDRIITRRMAYIR